MRVALATESFLPYVSGVTVSVDALARGLGARGHQVLLIAPRPAGQGVSPIASGSPGPDPKYAWVPSYELPRLVPRGYRMPWPMPGGRAWDSARAWRPDVVHAHSPFVSGVLARRLARSVGAPLVFTHHTRFADYGHYLGPLSAPGVRLTDAYLSRYWAGCAAIIAPSGDLADEIRIRLPASRRDRVHVVATGVDVAGIRALPPIDPRELAGWPADAVVVASLGRLAPEKSVGTLVDAMERLATEAPRARMLLIGGGPSEAALRARAGEPALHGRLHLTGPLPRLRALALLRGSDLFAFASRTETQGLVLAEALAAGLPAVAVEGPGVADSVRDQADGVIVPVEPAGALSARLGQALANLVNDEGTRVRMAGRASADAERFDLSRRVAEVEAVYAAVTAR
jgi:1,2-diacylglycerol 3-alpha-glucosyltransferase